VHGSDVVRVTLAATIELHEQFKQGDVNAVVSAADAITAAIQAGGKILVFGNGGSASDAQHVASELVGRFLRERKGLAAVALTTDSSVLTSIGNDYAFDQVFVRQIEALGRRGDVALGISTSGTSPNVVLALDKARAQGLRTIALTGRDGGAMGRDADIHVHAHSDSTPRVQELHRTLLHIICDLVERAFVA
jgi:D-sedoheptulose 7-phosphate isomerase